MINQFLATLDNNPTAPSSFIWPTFTALSLNQPQQQVRLALLGSAISRETQFIRALQLTDLVAESPFAPAITAIDPRLTYTKQTIRNRFQYSGIIVQDVTSGGPSGTILTCVVQPTAPESASWVVQMVGSNQANITDDRSNTVVVTVTFSGGISNTLYAPGNVMGFVLTGSAPATGDTWDVSYQKPGFSWVTQALANVQNPNLDCQAIMTPDLSAQYVAAPTQLDKLAAVVTAMGTIGG